MKDPDCVAFLRWCLPRLGLRWEGFRRVREQVCKRVARRFRALGLDDVAAYRERLASDPEEWERLDALCRVTISRFLRDRGVFADLGERVLPALARRVLERGGRELRAWSAGCASGEEAYTLRLLWDLELSGRLAPAELRVLATDADAGMVRRAAAARFPPSALRDVPARWRAEAFERVGGDFVLHERFRADVELAVGDVRAEPPRGPFDLVLCRNLAFTYLDEAGQRAFLARLAPRVVPGGALVLGAHESLPPDASGFSPWEGAQHVLRREAEA